MQLFLFGTSSNEVFYEAQFGVTPGFETTGVMKHEAWVAFENHVVLNIVSSSLR
jgi:hypothetical protein